MYELRREINIKTIQLSPHVEIPLPEDWTESPTDDGRTRIATPDGGALLVVVRDFEKPARPGTGSGPTSEQMVSMQVAQFGSQVQVLAPGRACSSHPVRIGAPDAEHDCRVWHVVNQVRPWHHEALVFTYEPPVGGSLDPKIVEVLDTQIPQTSFARSFDGASDEPPQVERSQKPWWRFW